MTRRRASGRASAAAGRGTECPTPGRRPSRRGPRSARGTPPRPAAGANPDPAGVAAPPQAGPHRGRRDDAHPRHLVEPGRRAAAPLRLGQRRPLCQHGQVLRLRADDRPMDAGGGRAPQGALPGHQGPAQYARAAPLAARPAARGAPDRLRQPVLPPRPGRRGLRRRGELAAEPRSSRRPPRRSASRARRSSSASRPTTRCGRNCSRRPRPAGSST